MPRGRRACRSARPATSTSASASPTPATTRAASPAARSRPTRATSTRAASAARGAGGKTVVFGTFQRCGNVYTEAVPDASKRSLLRVTRGQVALRTVIHSDGWRGYGGPVDIGYERHWRVHHGRGEFARGRSHINAIESFWGCAERRLVKFDGVPGQTFYLHLTQREFRYNRRRGNPCATLLQLLRGQPLRPGSGPRQLPGHLV